MSNYSIEKIDKKNNFKIEYKLINNKELLQSRLSEIPKSFGCYIFKDLDNNFCFDIDLRLRLISKNKKIQEVPIKTFYGTERSSYHFIYATRFFFKTIAFRIFK